jgi:hypothetical protein
MPLQTSMDASVPYGELSIKQQRRGEVRACTNDEEDEPFSRMLFELAQDISLIQHPGLASITALHLTAKGLEITYSVALDAIPLEEVGDAGSFLHAASMIAHGFAAAHASTGGSNLYSELDTQLLLARPGGGQFVGFGVWQRAYSVSSSTLRCPAGISSGPTMCPEWLLGRDTSPRTSTFFLAYALWVILCKNRPFPRQDPWSHDVAVRDGAIRPFSPCASFALPSRLRGVLEDALCSHPDKRASPGVFAEQLADLQG